MGPGRGLGRVRVRVLVVGWKRAGMHASALNEEGRVGGVCAKHLCSSAWPRHAHDAHRSVGQVLQPGDAGVGTRPTCTRCHHGMHACTCAAASRLTGHHHRNSSELPARPTWTHNADAPHAPDPPSSPCPCLQIKQAKLARELECSVAGERSLLERVSELEGEVRDVSSTSRSRIRWLEAASEQAKRRVEQLFRELEGAAPLKVGGPGAGAAGEGSTCALCTVSLC